MFAADSRLQQQTVPQSCQNIILAWIPVVAIISVLFIFTSHLSASLVSFIIVLFMTSFTIYYCYSYVPETEQADGEHGAAPAGLSPSYVKDIPTFTYQQNKCNGCDSLRCPVCITTVHDGDLVRQLLMCKHVFHKNCIDTWLPSHSTCPMCRADVKTGMISSEKELPV